MGCGGGCRTYHEIEVWTQSVLSRNLVRRIPSPMSPHSPPSPCIVRLHYRPLPLHTSANRWNSGQSVLYTFPAAHSWSQYCQVFVSLSLYSVFPFVYLTSHRLHHFPVGNSHVVLFYYLSVVAARLLYLCYSYDRSNTHPFKNFTR